MSAPTVVELLVLLGMGLVGLLLWRRLSRGLAGAGLQAEQTSTYTGWVGVLGYAIQLVAGMALVSAFQETTSLVGRLALQLAASVLATVVVLSVMARRPDGVRMLGLRSHRGPPAPLVALAAWLAFAPVFAGIGAVNAMVQEWFGSGPPLQEPLRLFLDDPAARSSTFAWLAIVLLLPAAEELLFRGAIYGALRRALHPAAAVALSALLFGLAHEPSVALPAAALGAVLAFLYERTGSLAAPLAFHALHNGVTLLLATLLPGTLT